MDTLENIHVEYAKKWKDYKSKRFQSLFPYYLAGLGIGFLLMYGIFLFAIFLVN